MTCNTFSAKIIIEDVGPDVVNRKLWTGTNKTIADADFQRRIEIIQARIGECSEPAIEQSW